MYDVRHTQKWYHKFRLNAPFQYNDKDNIIRTYQSEYDDRDEEAAFVKDEGIEIKMAVPKPIKMKPRLKLEIKNCTGMAGGVLETPD